MTRSGGFTLLKGPRVVDAALQALLILAVVFSAGCAGSRDWNKQDAPKAWTRAVDQLEIERLIHDYAALLDRGDYQAYGQLFAAGCLLAADGGVMARGADQVAALARHFLGSQTEKHTRHIISSPRIDIDADGSHATAQSFLTTIDAENDGPAAIFRIGHYKDRFQKREGRWSFASRQELTDWVLLERTQSAGVDHPVDVGSIVAAANRTSSVEVEQIECHGFDGEKL